MRGVKALWTDRIQSCNGLLWVCIWASTESSAERQAPRTGSCCMDTYFTVLSPRGSCLSACWWGTTKNAYLDHLASSFYSMQDDPFHREWERWFRVVLKIQHKVKTSFACRGTQRFYGTHGICSLFLVFEFKEALLSYACTRHRKWWLFSNNL